MAFVRTIPVEEATGTVKEIYDQDLQQHGYVANYTKALSLHPEIMVAWRNLSRAARANMDLRRYELVTIAVANRLRCSY